MCNISCACALPSTGREARCGPDPSLPSDRGHPVAGTGHRGRLARAHDDRRRPPHAGVPLRVAASMRISDAIGGGAVQPGILLSSEAELVELLEVSRTVVREALISSRRTVPSVPAGASAASSRSACRSPDSSGSRPRSGCSSQRASSVAATPSSGSCRSTCRRTTPWSRHHRGLDRHPGGDPWTPVGRPCRGARAGPDTESALRGSTAIDLPDQAHLQERSGT